MKNLVVLEHVEDGPLVVSAAVYHRTVAILGGLTTEIRFAPAVGDFLSEETRAALSSVGNLVFGLTEIPADGVVMGAGVFAMCPFNMTGGKIINNGTQNAPGSGIVVDDGGLLTLNGPVTISGNSVNVWSAPSGTVRRGPITLGEYFENYSEYPITVDTTSSYGSISVANVKTWWGSYSCLIGEQVAVVQFVPGKIALVSPGYSGYAPSSFRIFAGTFTIDDSTGCFILP